MSEAVTLNKFHSTEHFIEAYLGVGGVAARCYSFLFLPVNKQWSSDFSMLYNLLEGLLQLRSLGSLRVSDSVGLVRVGLRREMAIICIFNDFLDGADSTGPGSL